MLQLYSRHNREVVVEVEAELAKDDSICCELIDLTSVPSLGRVLFVEEKEEEEDISATRRISNSLLTC